MKFSSFPLSVVPILLLLHAAITSCGGQEEQVVGYRYELQPLYQEPQDTPDPALVFARDLLCLGGRFYVLDGRLSTVVVIDKESGELLDRFGGIGAGPGELGQFPYALVSDGERIGVAHLFQVSWFSQAGEFLEQEQIPPLDLATPSLQFSSGGWMFNATYRGPGSPAALYVVEWGDSLAYGTPVPAETSDSIGLASAELSAVHVCRFSSGNVLLGWSQINLIEILGRDGETIAAGSWAHLPMNPQRRADGRLENLPAVTFNATLGADGLAYILDGSMTVVRAYDEKGELRFEHHMARPVIKAVWSGGTEAYAIDGSDVVYRLQPVEEISTGQG